MIRRLHGFAGVALISVMLVLGACCATNTLRPLEKAKEMADRRDFAGLASLEVNCDAACEGCDQLHLLKGDACYRLAKAGQAPDKHYACAVAELGEGLRLARPGAAEPDKARVYTNLNDALRNWRDLSRGGEADMLNQRLLETSQSFLAAAPDNACAVYFLNNARYAELRACLLHPQNCADLCGRLQDLQRSLEKRLSRSAGMTCEDNLRQLAREVEQARRITGCP